MQEDLYYHISLARFAPFVYIALETIERFRCSHRVLLAATAAPQQLVTIGKGKAFRSSTMDEHIFIC